MAHRLNISISHFLIVLELTIISSLLGLSLGSFVNVCVYRFPRGISVVSVQSFCPHCRKRIRIVELIPVIGFLVSGGRCKSCGASISFLYPIIELLVAGVAVFVFYQNGISIRAFELLIYFLLMLTIALIDWKHFIISNQIIIFGLISGFLIKSLLGNTALMEGIVSSFLSFITLLVVMLLGNFFLKKQSMGIGDLKLAAVIGLFLGYQDFIITLWLAAICGAIYAFIINLKSDNSKLETQNSIIPFGSFLAAVSFFIFFFQQQFDGFLDAWLISNL